ncbi:hypothetical protein [Nonomuraea jabiensis]|uniref:Uncharacterized protein n=1 Tax=Nonomuraea jabiensis TaxID=882448 RepID=A0A7W9LEQ2_9ACTN|nr:hypothetical protein [Nonomuraea jabiensis]MBB5781075.1 hypothetical protein [Nonomuraea jabiensis]
MEPLAHVDEHGFARAQVTASWGAVGTVVAAVALDVDGYELYGRFNAAGQVWRQVTAIQGGDTTATFSPLPVNQQWVFKVSCRHLAPVSA